MKKRWEITRLGDICDLQNGFAFKSSDYINFSSTLNFRMSQIQPDGDIDLNNNPKYLPDEYAAKYKGYLLKEGDVVIAMTDLATETKILGVPTIVPKDQRNWLLNQRVGKLIKIDFSKVDVMFLKYILASDSINKYYKSLGRGGLQINISKKDILNAKIPIPPVSEQQRIVSILHEAFAAIARAKANAEQNLKNTKELFESYLQSVFHTKGEGWEENKLGDITFVKSGGTPSRVKKEYWGGNIAWYSSGELNAVYTKAPERYITDLAIKNSNAKLFPKGSLLIGMYDTAALKMSIIDRDATFNQAIAGVKLNKTIDLVFILHSINSIKPKLLDLRRGVRQKNLSLEKIKNIPIYLPPIETQQEVVKKLEDLLIETKKLEVLYQQKVNSLDELKKSILQKAFNGELKTSEPIPA